MRITLGKLNYSFVNYKFKAICYSYFLIFGALIIFYGCSTQKKPKPVQLNKIDSAIKRSTDYLVDKSKKNGMFEYRINMDSTIKVRPKYNILRHAGSVYSMVMSYQYINENKVIPAIERSGRYLQQKALFPLKEEENMKAIWSVPSVSKSRKPLMAKLGGSGLGLVALASIEDIHPGFTPLSELKELGNFIIHMQKENGSFYSKYIPSLGGRQDNWTSLYYPGEAALGLVMLYEKDSSIIWIESAYKALEYLALSRKESNNVPPDHWALLATERLLSNKESNKFQISRDLLINHAIQICKSMIEGQIIDPNRPKYNGGFHPSGNTTPTATRLEGLLAALKFIPKSDSMYKVIEASIEKGIDFLINAQIKDGQYAGAFPRSVGKIPKKNSKTKQFNQRATEVRIDYIQHAMSALIQYQLIKN